MRHIILTCKNHPQLRWSCKEIAFTEGLGYNGARSLSYIGTPDGTGMFSDGSGLSCRLVDENGYPVEECDCQISDLVLASEDALVARVVK